MMISIGILAHNESRAIGGTIASLGGQTIFHQGVPRINGVEVLCVPNGCTDDTADCARQAFDRLLGAVRPGVSWKVCELKEPGKSNAWNQYVHQFSDQAADYLILMDADIQLPDENALLNLVRELETNREAVVASGLPVKDLALRPRKGLFAKLSLGASTLTRAASVGRMAGCLYCIRGGEARSIWLPVGLLGEDGFLSAMVRTDQFRAEGDDRRIVQIPTAPAVFAAYRSPWSILRHEKRLVIGTALNATLFRYLAGEAGTIGAGEVVRRRLAEDPDWALKYFREQVKNGGWWVIPPDLLTKRLRALRKVGLKQRLKLLPVALIGFCMDLVVHTWANVSLRSGQGIRW